MTIFEQIARTRREFEDHLLEWLKESSALISEVKQKGSYIGTVWDWPELSFRPNGLPNLSKAYSAVPTDYSNVFQPSIFSEKHTEFDDIESIKKLAVFLKENPIYHERLVGKNYETELGLSYWKYMASSLAGAFYTWSFRNDSDFQESHAKAFLTPYLNFLFEPILEADILVPIIYAGFEFDNFDLPGKFSLEKIKPDIHLARYFIRERSSDSRSNVMFACTHAIRIRDQSFENNPSTWRFTEFIKKQGMDLLPLIDRIFCCLRLAGEYVPGYSQVLYIPKNWSTNLNGVFAEIQGFHMRRYPHDMDGFDFYNCDAPPKITLEQLAIFSKTIEPVLKNKDHRLDFAINRYNLTFERDNIEDIVVDTVIGLEALLGGGQKTEMAHRLSLRLAAILQKFDPNKYTSSKVFGAMKKIYNYRSSIVHGDPKRHNKREFEYNGSKVYADVLAFEFFQDTMKFLLEHPAYQDSSKIDMEILLGESPP